MSRKELYAQIVKLNLQGKVKEKYGVNYTNCKSTDLLEVINKALEVSEKTKTKCSVSINNKKFETLVNILKERHLLLKSDVEKIMNA